jgi:hypothetical protein
MSQKAFIPTPLPIPVIPTKWQPVTPEFRKTKAYWPAIEKAARNAERRPGWNPQTVQLAGFLVALDYSFDPVTGEVCAYKTGIVIDHPFLFCLPQNTPRAVKHLYRREVRLKYLFAAEGWDFMRDMRAATDAADGYNAATARLLA